MRPSSLVLSIGAACLCYAAGIASAQLFMFSDVPQNHWAANAIAHVSLERIMNGKSADIFDPNGTVNRAELATVSSRLLYRIRDLEDRLDYADEQGELSEGQKKELREQMLKDARDAQRRSDVNTILNAIYQYAIDHNGDMPAEFHATSQEICKTGATSCKGMVNLDALVGSYLVRVPEDPLLLDSIDRGTGYFIKMNTTGRITIEALSAENTSIISVTR